MRDPPVPGSILAAVAALASLEPLQMTIARGDAEAPLRWALALFGEESRPVCRRSRSSSDAVRPMQRDIVVEVDLFLRERDMLALLERARVAGAAAHSKSARMVPAGEVLCRLILHVDVRLSAPLVPTPHFDVVALSGTPENELETCNRCGARHRVVTARKAYPGQERDTFIEPCRRCWEGDIEVMTYGDYSVALIAEDVER